MASHMVRLVRQLAGRDQSDYEGQQMWLLLGRPHRNTGRGCLEAWVDRYLAGSAVEVPVWVLQSKADTEYRTPGANFTQKGVEITQMVLGEQSAVEGGEG